MEYEIKLVSSSGTIPDAIAEDSLITERMSGAWESVPMHTTYYDDEQGSLRSGHYTLRRRQEGARSVVTCKAPTGISGLREEFEAEAPDIISGIPLLVKAGAPEFLLQLSQPVPTCGAEFTRRLCLLQLENCIAELAIDNGRLYNGSRELLFSELELELKGGNPAAMLHFAHILSEKYSLHDEQLSKFARAVSL